MAGVLFLFCFLTTSFCADEISPPQPAANQGVGRRPNIIFILADDLGYEGVGAYGGKTFKTSGPVKTPHIDSLAKAGLLFKNCYATPVCSPARAEFLTGKYNFRVGFPDIAGRSGAVSSLDPKAHITLAAALKNAGYVTAVCGKWHLGPPDTDAFDSAKPETSYSHPKECGFDRQSIFGGPHLEHYGDPKSQAYVPAVLQKWALSFIREQKGSTTPFFLYYPSPIPHVPCLPCPLNPNASKDDRSNFAFLIEYLDQQVGEILSTLDETGLRENTIVVFSGDNGTQRQTTEMNDGRLIHGGKGTLVDSGSHVPLIASWPGVIKPSTSSDDLVDFSDLMPTFLELASAPAPSGIDGVSFAPQLMGKAGKPREWIQVHHAGHYFAQNHDYKLFDNGELYSIKHAPDGKLIPPGEDTEESKQARTQLKAALDQLYQGYTPPAVPKGKKAKKGSES